LSLRNVEDLLSQRGIDVSHEIVRRWSIKFGLAYARTLRKTHPRADVRWRLDELFVSINGESMYLWRAVDCEGEVLDVLVQSCPHEDDAKTAQVTRLYTSRSRDRQTDIVWRGSAWYWHESPALDRRTDQQTG
jgi:transposase-like protein